MTLSPLKMTHVTKRFGPFTAVDDITFDVPEGQIIGFLGPNGAGKSTSLRMALGVMQPDVGEVQLFGGPPNLKNLQRVGFLPEERGLYKKMTPRSTIAYVARLKGMSASDAQKRADELLRGSGLEKFSRTKNSKLSKGMSQKVQILSTLANRPDFLNLDEPFSGLDPVNQQGLEDMIRQEHERGATILLSTHVMEHAERLCDRIIMMTKGQAVFNGTMPEAYDILGSGARITLEGDFDLAAALAPKGFELSKEPKTDDNPNSVWRVSLGSGHDAQTALRASLEAGAPIIGFSPEQARLRDVFVHLAGAEVGKALDESKTTAAEAA